jgi:hypothetical protein
MSDRDVKKIWEASRGPRKIRPEQEWSLDRGGESAYGPNLPARPPSNLWFQIMGLDQSENWGKKISEYQLNRMVEFFLDFLDEGPEGREKYQAVLTELEILNDMETEVEHRAYANRLGFDHTIRPVDFDTLYNNLVIHINKSAANQYLSDKSSE